MQYWLNIYLNRINDAYTRIFEILDIALVEKKKSVIGAYLEEQGYIEEIGNYSEIVEPDIESFREKIAPMYDQFKDQWVDGMYEAIQAM